VLLASAIPLLMATVLTVAISGMWWPLSTAAVGCAAMLFGVGIDGVLLLYVRYLEERRNGFGAEGAIGRLPSTVSSMLLGFTTTAATYFGLLPIDFPSLNEVGRLIGIGILVSGVLSIAIVPALLPERVSARQAHPMSNDWLGRIVIRRRRTILWAAAALTLLLGAAAPGLRVDPALQRLQPQTEGTRVEREILTRFAVPDDVILLSAEGSRLEPLLEANQAVVDRLRVSAPDVKLTSPVSFIPPPAAQHAVRQTIRESGLSTTLVSERFVRAAGEAGFRADAFTPFLERLPRLLGASGALTYESYLEHGLGDLVRRTVTLTPTGYATVTYVYPRNAADYRAVEEAVRSSGQRLQITGATYVNQELSDVFAPQFLTGALIGSVAVAVLIFAGFRSVRYTLLSLVPTAVGLLWSVGVLALLDVQLDLFSVFAFLMCIGIGVDYSIHVLHRQATTHDGSVIGPLVSVSPAIIMAWATTMIGFGTLVTSSYEPLRSLGLVSVVTLTACLLTSMLVLPAVLLSSAEPES
jgi:predicted RND superfamily exporter protein